MRKPPQKTNLTEEALEACHALIRQSEWLNSKVSEYTLAGSPGQPASAWKVLVIRLDADGLPPTAALFRDTLFDDLASVEPAAGPGHGDS